MAYSDNGEKAEVKTRAAVGTERTHRHAVSHTVRKSGGPCDGKAGVDSRSDAVKFFGCRGWPGLGVRPLPALSSRATYGMQISFLCKL